MSSAAPEPPGDAPYVGTTRAGYDTIAEAYVAAFRATLAEAPLDRALLAGFAELVSRDHADRQTIDIGCGPGTVTDHLRQLGLDPRGIDLSPTMVEIARRTFPLVSFDVGDLTRLDAPDASAAAAVCWYSLIHLPAPAHPAALLELRRVLRPGGYLLLAFQVGHDTLHLDEAFGHSVNLDFHRIAVDPLVQLLEDLGFAIVATTVRASETAVDPSPVPQGFVIARRPPDHLGR